jgi:hypothetical protein
MNRSRIPRSLVYAVLLAACACFALYHLWGFMFEMGESGGPDTLIGDTILGVTLLGAAGLVIAALLSWTRWRALSLIATASAILALSAALIFFQSDIRAMWLNTRRGVYHHGLFAWAAALLPVPLDIAAVLWSWFRFRRRANPVD